MSSDEQIRRLAQLQRVQDQLSEQHQLSLVVLDADCTELTVPSGLPSFCGSADPTHTSTCWRMRREAIGRAEASRQAVRIPCPKGRCCFVSPIGVAVDDYDLPVPCFLAGSGLPESEPSVTLVQEIFRLITPGATAAPTASPTAEKQSTPFVNEIPLTNREMEILELIGAGWSNAQIAKHLYISQATVKTHVTHLLQKLGLNNRTEAALYALRVSAARDKGLQPDGKQSEANKPSRLGQKTRTKNATS